MTITVEGGEVVFRLSPEEASQVLADHGEGCLLLPSEDTLGDILAVGDAARAARRGGAADAGR